MNLTNPKASFYDNQVVDNSDTGILLTGSNTEFDMGGGDFDSTGNNTISGNGTYEVYNDSPNLIFAKYNYWDPLSYSEMAGHTYLEVDVTRIYDHWEDSGKGYVDWDEPGFPTRVELKSLGEIRASFYPSSNTIGQTKKKVMQP